LGGSPKPRGIPLESPIRREKYTQTLKPERLKQNPQNPKKGAPKNRPKIQAKRGTWDTGKNINPQQPMIALTPQP